MCHFPGHSFEGSFCFLFFFLWQIFFYLGGGVNFILKWNVPTPSPFLNFLLGGRLVVVGVILKVCIRECIVVRFPCFWNKQQIFTLFNGASSPNLKMGPQQKIPPHVKWEPNARMLLVMSSIHGQTWLKVCFFDGWDLSKKRKKKKAHNNVFMFCNFFIFVCNFSWCIAFMFLFLCFLGLDSYVL
jgi:hypothetical protein